MLSQLDSRSALVLIDLQNNILQRPMIHPTDSVLQHANQLIRAFRQATLPIIAVHVDPTAATWTKVRTQANQTAPKQESQPDIDFVPQLALQAEDTIILKQSWSAFFQTPLQQFLQQQQITQIVLGGVATSIGVEGTARSASELGYNIAFAIDAMSDYIASAHQHSLQYIFPRLGELASSDEIIQMLAA